jgi:hypothetical protein
MANNVSIDASELQKLSVNLGRASAATVQESRAVIAKGALNIKNDTREHISDDPYWKRLAQRVNFEQVGLSAEIGYDDVGQGELAGIYEFGSVKRAPHPTLIPAFEREAPRFEKAMGDLVAKAIGDAL